MKPKTMSTNLPRTQLITITDVADAVTAATDGATEEDATAAVTGMM